MAATQRKINEYIYGTLEAYVDYGVKLANYQKLGEKNIECNKFKFRLLNYFIRILIDFFDGDDYTLHNFFTVSEINDVMQHVNNITNTNYWVDLN